MKKKLIGLLLVLVTMVSIPLFAVENSAYKEAVAVFAHKSDKKNENEQSKILGITAAKFRKEYSEETLKAIVIILNTNYMENKNNFNLNDSKDYLSQKEFNKKYGNDAEKYYSMIENATESAKGKYITYKSKAVYIPFFYLSEGYTERSLKYPYIRNSASPWDCLSKGYKENNNTTGVSLNGLNTLCKKGLSCKKALKWYLQDIKITAAK